MGGGARSRAEGQGDGEMGGRGDNGEDRELQGPACISGIHGLGYAIFELTKSFPAEEKFSMVDQVRRSSRSVCANIAEAWRKQRYKAHFVSKLNDAESEAEETRVWLEFARRCGYLKGAEVEDLDAKYNDIIGKIVRM